MTVREGKIHQLQVTPKELDDIMDRRRKHLIVKGYIDEFMVGDVLELIDGTKLAPIVRWITFVERFNPAVKAGHLVISLGEKQ